MSKIAELFTHPTTSVQDWQTVVNSQWCAYLGLQAKANVELEVITRTLESKISPQTLLKI